MRPFLLKLVSMIIFGFLLGEITLGNSSYNEARLIRRVFLDAKHVPPSIGELDWYLCYNTNPYEAAVNWIVSDPAVLFSKQYFLSEKYKTSSPTFIDQSTQEQIIKYQAGNINLTLSEAEKLLIHISMLYGDGSITNTIDYLSLLLTSNVTTVNEINFYLDIFKQYSSEKEGYLAVLQNMKTQESFLKK